jgi:hypothetical protein
MKPQRTAEDPELQSIPTEFRENYRFLSELIDCREWNNSFKRGLKALIERNAPYLTTGRLNQRQTKLVKSFFKALRHRTPDCFSPPVPAELEASIRIRDKSTWLPWEAEAIQKIELWRGDISCIRRHLARNCRIPKGRPTATRVMQRHARG